MWMRTVGVTLILTLIVNCDEESRRQYKGYQVVRTFPNGGTQLDIMRDLQEIVDTWTPVSDNVTSVDMLIGPNKVTQVKKLLKHSGISYTTTILDLQAAIDVENIESAEDQNRAQFKGSCSSISGMSWSQYQSYDTLSHYMDCLQSSYSSLVTLSVIGYSSENRPLKVMKIGTSSQVKKPAVWIDGGIHAREWISPAAVSYVMKELVENSASYLTLLDSYDFYIMPNMNPDGYEYTRVGDRMWRKSRNSNTGTRCRGVDLNRNWDYGWGGLGTSGDPCSGIYRGPSGFSEPETQAVRDYILARKSDIKLYLTFHSYGQMILYPWGYDVLDHSDENELKRFGRVAARAMGRGYKVGNSAKVLYPAAGASDDWAKGGAGIRYSYTIELPDTGVRGFILPANQIKQVGKEALQATRVMVLDLINKKAG